MGLLYCFKACLKCLLIVLLGNELTNLVHASTFSPRVLVPLFHITLALTSELSSVFCMYFPEPATNLP